MASNNYNAYNYVPYQQSAAQQYPTYQTAPSNTAQPSRQYQQPASTQASDYMPYTGSSYSAQGNGYGHTQVNSWDGSNYGSTRETTRGAAEALRNMSNNTYAPSNTTNRAQATNHRGLPSPAMAAAHPSQRSQSLYNQQQRSVSPAQTQYNTPPASSAIPSAIASTSYDYNHRKLPGVETTRAPQAPSTASSFHYTSNYPSAPTSAPPAPTVSVNETSSAQRATTVDPSAVYDPYADIQRRAEIARAEKAIRAEKTREEAIRAQEVRIATEARKTEEQKAAEARKRQEEDERLRQPRPQPKSRNVQKQQPNTAEVATKAPEPSETPAEDLEGAMRAMMAKMRELNSKDPAMLARIWEEERRAKAPKSPTAKDKPVLQVPVPLATQLAQPIRDVPPSNPPIAESREKTIAKEALTPNTAKIATSAQRSATPVRHKAQGQAVSNRSGANTIWPPEKRAQLAHAAVSFLQCRNPAFHLEPSRILRMLDSNPSYIQLCEQLEQLGLKLDRAAFAKNLLTAVPDVNSGFRKAAPQPALVPVSRPVVPPAVMKIEMAAPAVPILHYTPVAASPANSGIQTASPAAPAPVAEMVPIKAELKPPANKEEAARKRNLSDLIDLTQLSDEEERGPPVKRLHADAAHSFGSPYPLVQDAVVVDAEPVTVNFPIANILPPAQRSIPNPMLAPASEFRNRAVVESMDRKKALRRNNYNPATIARDVLLACGRHPSERHLNQHLDGLRTTLGIPFDSDLSTIGWDLLDPGTPPPGYFKESVHDLTGDADDEEDSEDEGQARPRALSHTIGGESGALQVQALPEAINPFKPKRRGRPPRHSFPDGKVPATPQRTTSTSDMSASAPRPTPAAAGVGYHAFRSVTQYGPDGEPLPKKKGRPVGWRKAIHGSSAVLARSTPNGRTGSVDTHQPSQPNSLRNTGTREYEPIRIESKSPSDAKRVPQLQSYNCKWHNCEAELHNLETLKKHVFKVHRKETFNNTLECLWHGCSREAASDQPLKNKTVDLHSFVKESDWRYHVQRCHIDPLSWELGDGPASGLSGKEDD